MKVLFKTVTLLLVALLAFTACNKDDENATPVIQYVRPTDANAADSLLVSASMGQTIAIIGDNLHNVIAVYFNDQKAKLNPTMVTKTSIIVTVPGTIPTIVTNTITLKTKEGKSVDYSFATKITPPMVNSISCEWAPEGSEAIIYGSYFFPTTDGNIEVVFPGNLIAEVIEFTDEQIKVTVPTGALKGYITVSNDYGKGRSPFIFKDNTGVFIDAENPGAWNWWGLSDFGTENGLNGAYLKFEGTTGSWVWPSNAIQLLYFHPDGTPLVSEGNVTNYALKFECYCHEWHDTPMLIWFDNTGTHNVDGPNAQYHWKPYNNNGVSVNYTTNGWTTVTMPLSDFKYSKDESESSRIISGLSELQNLNIIWFGAINASSTEFGLKIWIDNVRLVQIK